MALLEIHNFKIFQRLCCWEMLAGHWMMAIFSRLPSVTIPSILAPQLPGIARVGSFAPKFMAVFHGENGEWFINGIGFNTWGNIYHMG